MAKITLSSKHQITLPADMVRKLGLKPGDKLVADLIDDCIVLLPEPESWTEHFGGIARGVYGSTDKEIDAYIEGERSGSHRQEWRLEFEELVKGNDDVRKLVNAFREGPHRLCTLDELRQWTSLGEHQLANALEKLLDHGSVRRSFATRPGIDAEEKLYYLVRDFKRSEKQS